MTKQVATYLADGLLNSSDVRIEEMSKMLADILIDPRVDCFSEEKDSTLLANKSATQRRNSCIISRS